MTIVPLADRFWANVRKTDTCWLWEGTTNGEGYGHISIHGRKVRVHRLSYEWVYGPIPKGMCVCHRCDVRACVRPDHLFPGTYRDNLHDASVKGRMQHGSTHYKAKLTDDDVREIRKAVAAGERRTSIMKRFSVSRRTVYAIAVGAIWRHVK